MRDNATNDVSSRSVLVLNVYTSKDTKYGPSHEKKQFVDLAGQERAARLEINEKRYREALFINETLDCLMKTVRRKAKGIRPDFNIHPIMNALSDALGAGMWPDSTN